MKKIVKMALVLVVLLIMAAKAETYPAVFVVYEIDYTTDTMTLIDFNGWMWDVYGVEDFMVGDVVGAVMDDVGTEIIYDDEIQYIRYCGWLEEWKDGNSRNAPQGASAGDRLPALTRQAELNIRRI